MERARGIEIHGIRDGAVCVYVVAEHIDPMSLGNLRQNTHDIPKPCALLFLLDQLAKTDH